jgi:hypothetical protein
MKKVDVYWNLKCDKYSLLDRSTRRVCARKPQVRIQNAQLIVNPKGRDRVLREKRKNVHAFIRGEMSEEWCEIPEDAIQIHYNPYRAPYWTKSDLKTEICEVAEVWCITSEQNTPQVFAICNDA